VRLIGSAIELLVVSHGFVFINVSLLCLVARKHAEGGAEQTRVSRVTGMLSCGVSCGRVVVRATGHATIRGAT
jgi:hypothetical protein